MTAIEMKIEENQYKFILQLINNNGKCEYDRRKMHPSYACKNCSLKNTCVKLRAGCRVLNLDFNNEKVEFLKNLVRKTL